MLEEKPTMYNSPLPNVGSALLRPKIYQWAWDATDHRSQTTHICTGTVGPVAHSWSAFPKGNHACWQMKLWVVFLCPHEMPAEVRRAGRDQVRVQPGSVLPFSTLAETTHTIFLPRAQEDCVS